MSINSAISEYNNKQSKNDQLICETLMNIINDSLPMATHKIWHGAPVWFINENPVVGYVVRKNDVQLLFWSGQSFDETGLQSEGSFKAAGVRLTDVSQIKNDDLMRWLQKAQRIQWDYKNIVKRKGVLERI